MTGQPFIQLRHVVREYPQLDGRPALVALDDINLDIHKGSFTCIVGESGCGKTSLLRLLAGLDTAASGSILFDGKSVNGPNEKCGMVFQKNSLFPWLTVRENVAFGPKRTGHYKGNEKQIDELLRMVRIEAFAESYPAQLSGGMQQRVALAQSLANKPETLLLDEPLSALDAFTRMHLQDELLRLWQLNNNTVVMITHDIDEAIYLADTIVLISPRPGRISSIEENKMSYPRDRTSDAFLKLRNQLLIQLSCAK